ncbi:MAG: hypothetical protein R2862_04090 [Thermoanaerobaculia bacterium]
MLLEHRFEFARPPLTIDLAGLGLTPGSKTRTAPQHLGETTLSQRSRGTRPANRR